jgi:hypothetical protein
MNQPVRVSLVFPRSGQQVFVNVPPHVARYVESLRSDHKQQPSGLYTPSAASHGPRHSGGDTHAQ